MPIYEVEVVQSGSMLIEADSFDEAEEIGEVEIEMNYLSVDATETFLIGDNEHVLCVGGEYLQYKDLQELAAALEGADPLVDPNQGVLL